MSDIACPVCVLYGPAACADHAPQVQVLRAERDAFRAVLADLVATLPQCIVCDAAPATRAYGLYGSRYCDACAPTDAADDGVHYTPPTPPEYPRAPALRRALALLRMHESPTLSSRGVP